MPSVNKVVLLGNLGSDPELAATRDNRPVAKISLATNRKWKDKISGQTQEKTTWHRVIFFDRLAEIANQYLHKGNLCFIEGRLNTRSWQTDSGETRYMTEVIAENLQLMEKPQESYPQQPPQQPQQRMEGRDDYSDDIPF